MRGSRRNAECPIGATPGLADFINRPAKADPLDRPGWQEVPHTIHSRGRSGPRRIGQPAR
jgi:hypothetical protein